MEGPEQHPKSLGKIDNFSPRGRTLDTSLPAWLRDITDAIIQVYLAWPKHHGTGRPLPFEKCSPGAAAAHAIEKHYLDPKAPERFLKEWLGVTEVTPEHIEALWKEVERELEKPFDPKSWFSDPDRAIAYLRVAVSKEAQRIKDRRDIEDKAWGTRQRYAKNLPEQCEYMPDIHDKNNNEVSIEDLLEFQGRELDLREQIKGALPERQYQVFYLRAGGASYKEIAKKLGISTSAAKSNMSHARRNSALQRVAEQWNR